MQELPTNNRKRATDLSKTLHWVNLFITIIFITLSVANWQCFYKKSRFHGFCYTGLDFNSGGGYALLLILSEFLFFFLYCRDCRKSATRAYLKKDMEIKEYESFLREMKASPPQIGTKIECWHSEGSGDDSETVTTFTGTSFWNYRSWNDATGDIVGMSERKI